MVSAAQRSGELRDDIGVGDIPLLFSCLTRPPGHVTPEISSTIGQRYLAVVLDGLRAGDPRTPLPGRPPTRADVDRTFFEGGT